MAFFIHNLQASWLSLPARSTHSVLVFSPLFRLLAAISTIDHIENLLKIILSNMKQGGA